MTVVAASLVTASPAAMRLSFTMGLRSLMNLRRRALRTRLRLRPVLRARGFHALLRLRLWSVFHPGLRLHRTVLCSRSFHARLRLGDRSILNVRLRLRPVLEPRLRRIRLRLHRAVLYPRSLWTRLRLRPILKPGLWSVGLRLTVLKRRICRVWLRLRTVLEVRVAIGLRRTILNSCLVPIRLPMESIGTLVHRRHVWLCRTHFRP